ncbi:MAG: hypothetical protein AAF497_08290, partial [Planctomycetota bacterium]
MESKPFFLPFPGDFDAIHWWLASENHAQRVGLLRGQMLDFEVKRCTRKCSATDEALKPGEDFYSVLVAEGAEVVRRDFSQAAWSGPPENHIGWWKSRMPDPDEKKVDWAPSDVILHYFQQLGERPESAD